MAEHTCDRTIIIVPMVLNGDFPKPDFLYNTNFECIPIFLSFNSIARQLNIPIFMVDRHFDAYSLTEDEEKLQYLKSQLEKVIEFVEDKIPGCKYNEDKLKELQYYDRLFVQKNQELYDLRKHIPCPIPGRDAFRELRLASVYPHPQKVIDYMRIYVEEMAEKAARGEGAVEGEEKLRLLWSVSGPFFADPFGWLAKKGVAVPAAEMSVFNMWFSRRQPIWGDPWKGRELTPLEEEARQLDWVWGRLGDWWVQTNINTCKDLKLDGIVYFMQWGCSVTNNLGKVIVETAEKECGIPTLLIEGRMLDENIFDRHAFLVSWKIL
jgi:benzoyl-CoA reductase/2-hydroxyglutaryl-CoA dehydratase subunit BcrC/BadD/HgdB